jgi:dienelactone hydrolase
MSSPIETKAVKIPAGDVSLSADLNLPEDPVGLVVFAHGSGSSRLSPRNRAVAEQLNGQSLATLLLDLLTEEEDLLDQRTRELRFNIPLLANRLEYAVDAPALLAEVEGLPVGLFGASTGAAAALIAAARKPQVVQAVVSRGGRPDLAADVLKDVKAPSLLIVGSLDQQVLELNQQALEALKCDKHLETVTGATHLFEEPGALEQVAILAADWFLRHLG